MQGQPPSVPSVKAALYTVYSRHRSNLPQSRTAAASCVFYIGKRATSLVLPRVLSLLADIVILLHTACMIASQWCLSDRWRQQAPTTLPAIFNPGLESLGWTS